MLMSKLEGSPASSAFISLS